MLLGFRWDLNQCSFTANYLVLLVPLPGSRLAKMRQASLSSQTVVLKCMTLSFEPIPTAYFTVCKTYFNGSISFMEVLNAMYSLMHVDVAIVSCNLDFQIIGQSARQITYPVLLFTHVGSSLSS